jgi:hypothetical protein
VADGDRAGPDLDLAKSSQQLNVYDGDSSDDRGLHNTRHINNIHLLHLFLLPGLPVVDHTFLGALFVL